MATLDDEHSAAAAPSPRRNRRHAPRRWRGGYVFERKFRLWILLMSLVAVGLSAAATQVGALRDASRWVEDRLQAGRLHGYDHGVRLPQHRLAAVRSRGEEPVAADRDDPSWADLWDVAIVQLDDRSYRLLDGYPFTPEEDARVLRTLADFGARVIVYDRLLSERRRKIVGPAGVEPLVEALQELAERRPPTRVALATELDATASEAVVRPLPELLDFAEPGYLNLHHREGDMIRDYVYRQHDHFSLAMAAYLLGLDYLPDEPQATLAQQFDAWYRARRRAIVGFEHREPYLLPGTPQPRMLNFYAEPGGAFVHVSYWELYRAYPLARVRALAANAVDDAARILEGDDFAEAWALVGRHFERRPQPEDMLEVTPWLDRIEALYTQGLSQQEAVALDNLAFLLEDAQAFAEEAHRSVEVTLRAELQDEHAAALTLLQAQTPQLVAALDRLDDTAEAKALRAALAEPELSAPQREALAALLTLPDLPQDAQLLFEDTLEFFEHLARIERQLDRIRQFPLPPDPEEEEMRRQLAGKHVLIGPWTLSSHDLYRVPVATGEMSRMYGVEIHATALQNLIDLMDGRSSPLVQQGLIRTSETGVLWITMLVTLIACLVAMLFKPLPGAALLLLGGGGYFLYVQNVFVLEWIFLPSVFPLLGVVLAYGVVTVTKVLTIDEERRVVEDLFKSYMDRRFVELLMADPEKVKLGGERRPVTVYFSDIAGFSAISEQLEPEQLVTLINEYLGEMSDVVLRYDGTLDKYIGDAIMAFWNAPVDVPQHAAKACLAAIEQRERLAALNAAWTKRDLPALGMRIGLNTGEVVHGNMGSELKKNYTIMGDAVNLAARLEPLNKEFDTSVLISEATWQDAQEAVEARCLGLVRVAGREEPVRFYELLGRKGTLSADEAHFHEVFAEALKAYIDGSLGPAEELFNKAAKLRPDDGPTRVYRHLVERHTRFASDELWSGVYIQTGK